MLANTQPGGQHFQAEKGTVVQPVSSQFLLRSLFSIPSSHYGRRDAGAEGKLWGHERLRATYTHPPEKAQESQPFLLVSLRQGEGVPGRWWALRAFLCPFPFLMHHRVWRQSPFHLAFCILAKCIGGRSWKKYNLRSTLNTQCGYTINASSLWKVQKSSNI